MIIIVNDEGEAIAWEEGKEFPKKENLALCRCGKSRDRPFCDGTHEKVDFDGTETADNTPYLDNAALYDGPTLELTDYGKLCASAGFCDPEGGTWELTRHSDEPRARALAIRQVSDCPSGRLVAWEKETKEQIEPEFEPFLGIVEDPSQEVSGPIWVRGKIPIESADGKMYEVRNRVTLCRCGKSANKPFCDGSHLD